MLPGNKPLTDRHTSTVIERFSKYIQDRRLTLAQVAREVNYSESVISQWRSDKYTGDYDAVTRAINGWLERDARRVAAARPRDEVKTWVAETIRTIAYQADKRGMMAVIVAPAGAGKSKVLQALTEELRGVHLTAFEGLTARQFLMDLATALGRKGRYGDRGTLLRWIITALRGTKRILFLDEAHLMQKAINCVRSIHDQAAVPIVMAGTADILKYVDDRTDGRGQFSSRCLQLNIVDAIADAESPNGGNSAGRDLFTIDEIKAFFASRQIRLADDALHMLWALACLPNWGTLRLIGNLAEIALDVTGGAELLTREHIRNALQLVVGGRAKYVMALADRQEQRAQKVKVA